jgi:acetyl esterase/lipase
VAVAGDSAGGNLAEVVTNEVPILAQFLIYPMTDSVDESPLHEYCATGHLLNSTLLKRLVLCGRVQCLLTEDVRSAHSRQLQRWINDMNPLPNLCRKAYGWLKDQFQTFVWQNRLCSRHSVQNQVSRLTYL